MNLISRNSHYPWVFLNWDPPVEKIYKEFNGLNKDDLFEHRGDETHINWFASTLFGYSKNQTRSHWEYRHKAEGKKDITSVGEKCPETMKWIAGLPFTKIYDVRFLLVKAGGRISPHVDVSDRYWLDPVSIAVKWPNDCNLKFTDIGTTPLKTGISYVLNIHYEHSVENNSDEDRVVLVIHGKKAKTFWDDAIIPNEFENRSLNGKNSNSL